jgi:hypothetical protein
VETFMGEVGNASLATSRIMTTNVVDRFDISQSEATAGVPGGLKDIVWHNVLAAWRHDSGAWLTIEQIPGFSIYMVVWHAVPYWAGRVMHYEAAFELPDDDLAWPTALHAAHVVFDKGPRGPVLEKAIETMGNLRANASRGGKSSGRVRSAKAAQNAEDLAKARAAALKHFKTEKIPKYDPKLWYYEIQSDLYRPHFALGYKSIPATCVFSMMAPETGLFYVEREYYPDGNTERARIEEIVMSDVPYERACEIASNLAASDPVKWLKGCYSDFLD